MKAGEMLSSGFLSHPKFIIRLQTFSLRLELLTGGSLFNEHTQIISEFARVMLGLCNECLLVLNFETVSLS